MAVGLQAVMALKAVTGHLSSYGPHVVMALDQLSIISLREGMARQAFALYLEQPIITNMLKI